MDLNLLIIFKSVAEFGSLTKASKFLNIPKSKISRDLVKLEKVLEHNLLIRSPRGIILTDHGASLINSIKTPIEEIEASLSNIISKSNEMRGSIKLTAPEDLSVHLLSRICTEFTDIYPDIEIELYATGQVLDFKKDKIDLALRIGKLENSSLIQRKITEIDVYYIASKKYLSNSMQIKTIQDLSQHKLAIFRDLEGKSYSKNKNISDLPIAFSSNSTSVLKEFVKSHKGIATLPSFLVHKEIHNQDFIKVLPSESYINRSLFLLSAPATNQPKHVKLFKDFLVEKLKNEIL